MDPVSFENLLLKDVQTAKDASFVKRMVPFAKFIGSTIDEACQDPTVFHSPPMLTYTSKDAVVDGRTCTILDGDITPPEVEKPFLRVSLWLMEIDDKGVKSIPPSEVDQLLMTSRDTNDIYNGVKNIVHNDKGIRVVYITKSEAMFNIIVQRNGLLASIEVDDVVADSYQASRQ